MTSLRLDASQAPIVVSHMGVDTAAGFWRMGNMQVAFICTYLTAVFS